MGKLTLKQLLDHNQKYNIRFEDLVSFLKRDGWDLDRIKGSHHIFKKPNSPIILIQPDADGKAKAYQVKQVGDLYR